MNTFQDVFKFLRKQKGYTQDKMAEELHVAKSTVSMWEGGNRMPPFEKLEEIADYFNVTMSFLTGRNEQSNLVGSVLPVAVRRVPILGGAACGEPVFAPGDETDYATVEGDTPCDFALIAQGDSMIGDRIHDGDVVFFRSQPDVNDGQIAAVSVDDGVSIKRVARLRGANGSVLYTQLLSSNPAYSPITIGGEDDTRVVRIMGKAVAFKGPLNK